MLGCAPALNSLGEDEVNADLLLWVKGRQPIAEGAGNEATVAHGFDLPRLSFLLALGTTDEITSEISVDKPRRVPDSIHSHGCKSSQSSRITFVECGLLHFEILH